MHYDRGQIITMICFLFLQAYSPLARQAWTRIANRDIASTLVKAVCLLEAGAVSIFSITLLDIVLAEIAAQVWQIRTAHLGEDTPLGRIRPPRQGMPPGDRPDNEDAAFSARSCRTFQSRALEAVGRMDLARGDPRYDEEAYCLHVFMSESFAHDPHCPGCCEAMVPVAKLLRYGPQTLFPSMVSLDAIRPRRSGGGYWNDNIQLVDIACNVIKLDFELREALVLIGHLGGQRDLSVDENGMLCPPTESRVDHATMNTAVVQAWAQRALGERCRPMRHAVELTLEELVRVLKPYMVTETTYRDPSGKELPLALDSLDRVDSNGIYEQGNVRPLFTGLNLLRRRCVNDAPIIDYLKQISPELVSRSLRLQQEGVRLPFSDRGDRILAQDNFEYLEPLPIETVEVDEAVENEDLEACLAFEDLLVHQEFASLRESGEKQ